MSQIKLKHSGGNSVIIAAPDSNPASDRTLKLPSDGDGTILTSNSSVGKILQVKQTVKTDKFSTTSFTSYTDIGPQGSITATTAGNKIMVEIMLNVSCDNSRHIAFRLEKDGAAVSGAQGDAAGSNRKQGCFHLYSEDQNGRHNQTTLFLKYLDTAADTNAHTYNIACIDWGGQGTTQITCNSSENDGDLSYESRTISTVTLSEVAA